MVERTVIFDVVNYKTGEQADDPLVPGRKVDVIDTATKGQRISLPAEEAKRLDALGATDADAPETKLVIPENYSGSGLADALGGAVPNPPEETAKVAGIVNVDADEVDPEASSIGNIDEVAKVAGFDLPAGAGVDLHDNERTAGLAKFLGDTGTSTGTGDAASATDDEMAAMNATELVAYLNQHPAEVDRVEAVNAGREKPWATVTKAVEASRQAQEEQAAAAAASASSTTEE